jgi:F0F1-type ATP synthase membrane subunit c/vacuolar-type H+-ATPase subunit K
VEASEHDRRVAVIVHTAMLASVGVYGVLLAFLRAELAPEPVEAAPATSLFAVFSAIGVARFAGASLVGRKLLSAPRGAALDRVRRYFLLRAAAAEAIALYGLILGFLKAPLPQVLALFGISVAALLACSPGKEAWAEALRRAKPPVP